MSGARSYTTTARPARASVIAAVSPAGPAPRMRVVSVLSAWTVMGCASRLVGQQDDVRDQLAATSLILAVVRYRPFRQNPGYQTQAMGQPCHRQSQQRKVVQLAQRALDLIGAVLEADVAKADITHRRE